MSGKTHAMVGANAVWVATLFYSIENAVALLIAVGALAALLPDIDAPHAKIHYVGKGALGMFKGVFHHRGFFHSLLAIAIVAVLSTMFLRQYHPALPLIITLAYASHPFIDGFNYAGVEYLCPSRKRIHLLPKFLRSQVNGPFDQLLFVLGAGGLLFLLLGYSGLVISV